MQRGGLDYQLIVSQKTGCQVYVGLCHGLPKCDPRTTTWQWYMLELCQEIRNNSMMSAYFWCSEVGKKEGKGNTLKQGRRQAESLLKKKRDTNRGCNILKKESRKS